MADRNRTPRYGMAPGVWYRRDSPLSANERLVLFIIGLHSHRDHAFSYPSLETIAAEAALGKTATRYALGRLSDLGPEFKHAKAIDRVIHKGRPTTYRILHLDWKQDDGVPWVTKHPIATRWGQGKKGRTPPRGDAPPPSGELNPTAWRADIKGVNSTFNNSRLSAGREIVDNAPPLASALEAPRDGAPDVPASRSGRPWRAIPCMDDRCGAILNKPDGSAPEHVATCRVAWIDRAAPADGSGPQVVLPLAERSPSQ